MVEQGAYRETSEHREKLFHQRSICLAVNGMTIHAHRLAKTTDHRLTYHNLKKRRSANSLGTVEVDKLWVPFIVFQNTENSEATQGDVNSEVTVTREGDFTRSGEEVVEKLASLRRGLEKKQEKLRQGPRKAGQPEGGRVRRKD